MQKLIKTLEKLDKDKYKSYMNENNLNTLFNGYWIYSLPEYKTYITSHLSTIYTTNAESNAESNETAELATEIINSYFQNKLKFNYLLKIQPILESYNKIPHIEQKTSEWIEQRRQIITASEAGYLLGICGVSAMMTYLLNKVDTNLANQNSLRFMPSVQHGTIFEDVSRMIYESRNNITVREYGLIKSSTTPFLGASPDGIVNSGIDECNPKIGRLVEIKNPYKFDPTDNIKPEYLIQIYQQQYVLGLPLCDFIKTNIIGANVNDETITNGYTPYKTLDQLLNDTPGRDIVIYNTNLPRNNLNGKGMEKGILISYKGVSGDIKVVVYPMNIEYNKENIMEWIQLRRNELIVNGVDRNSIVVQYWYVAKYVERVVMYDAALFENNYLPRLKLLWNLVEHLKTVYSNSAADSGVFNKFIDTQMKPYLKKPSKFYSDVANFDAICVLLRDAAKMQPILLDNLDNLEKTMAKNKVKKTKSKSKPRVEIELDF
jgi:putative phage-type endonuclease